MPYSILLPYTIEECLTPSPSVYACFPLLEHLCIRLHPTLNHTLRQLRIFYNIHSDKKVQLNKVEQCAKVGVQKVC